MNQTSLLAHSIPCPRCGGIFPVSGVASAIVCPYCTFHFVLTQQALADLERYQREVHAALGQANAAHQQSAQWGATAQSVRSSWVVFPLLAGLVVLAIPGAVLLQMALEARLLPEALIPVFSIALVFGVLSVAVGVSIWLSVRARRAADSASAGNARVGCPSCGAPNELAAGQVLQSCRYCRAALMPSQAVMARGVDAARAAQRAAEIKRYRAERAGMVAVMGRATSNAGPYIVLGSFLPVTGGITMVMAGQLVLGYGKVPLLGLATVLALTCLNIALIAAIYSWRSWWKQRFSTSLADLVHQFRGELLPGLPGVVRWLDGYWASPYELHFLTAGPYHSAARIDAGGYATLIDVDPVPVSDHYSQRVHILVAAAVPEFVPQGASPAVAAARAWIEQAGFTVTVVPSGLLARAEGKTLRRLCKKPESLHVLSTVITTLSGLARGLGAVPVEALA